MEGFLHLRFDGAISSCFPGIVLTVLNSILCVSIFIVFNEIRHMPISPSILAKILLLVVTEELIENETEDIILVFVGIVLLMHLVRRCPYFIYKLLLF